MYRILIGIIGIAALFIGSTGYNQSIQEWQMQRDSKLRSPDGWLTLVGLFWLEPGTKTIGSGEQNGFVLPKGSSPLQIGSLKLDGQRVVFTPNAGAAVTVDGKPVHSPVPLSYDEEKPDVVKAGTVSFIVIKRLDKLGIRARDSAGPVLKNFQGMKYFPTNPNLRIEAKFVPDVKKVPILNILGQTEMQESPGVVEFAYHGQNYRLRPIYEGKTLFFLFKDPTNRTQTYQAGRMLNTPLPVNGKVDLDFNHSYNPPCTFTPYATCPLPPKENTLPFAVDAGELRYGKGHVEYTASR